jgi:glycosyltransferase involved in cell wall biosynthesis
MKSILIIAFSDLNHDARVNRQINFLKDTYDLSVASFSHSSVKHVKPIQLQRVKPGIFAKIIGGVALLITAYRLAYKIIYNQSQYEKLIGDRKYDLILANDIETLPLALTISKGSKVLFDAHEYAPRHFEDKLVWKIFFSKFNQFLCKKYLLQIDAMLTVGQGLAKEYAKHFPVSPIVLTNANYFCDLNPKPTESNKIKLVHHGAANPSRQLELMIATMKYLDDRFTLDMILLTPAIANKKTKRYLDTIKKMAIDNPRVKILPPVKNNEVVGLIHNYDVGVFLLPPINFNYKNTLPNKLFDYVQARLAIAVGPTPEMADLVLRNELGVVSSEFTPESFAKALSQLTHDKIDYFKEKSNQAAKELSAENNKIILNKIVSELLAN